MSVIYLSDNIYIVSNCSQPIKVFKPNRTNTLLDFHSLKYTYIYTCIHTYIYTYIHTYIHTYIYQGVHRFDFFREVDLNGQETNRFKLVEVITYIHTFHTNSNTLLIHTYIHTYIHNIIDIQS